MADQSLFRAYHYTAVRSYNEVSPTLLQLNSNCNYDGSLSLYCLCGQELKWRTSSMYQMIYDAMDWNIWFTKPRLKGKKKAKARKKGKKIPRGKLT